MTEWYVVGEVRVRAFTDAVGLFFQPAREAFPDAPETAWRAARQLDPEVFASGGRWRLRFHCFLVTTPTRTILVDAGIGPAGSPAASWAPVPGRLPDELAAAGVDPARIDVVVLTHLHTDHVGWTVAPTHFPNARHVVHRADYHAVDRLNPDLRQRMLDPLRNTDRLQLVDGATPLGPGVRVVPAPGHTPGHQVVLVSHGDEVLAIAGDLMAHPVQLVDPDVAYRHEAEPTTARQSRRRLLSAVTTVAASHFTAPFVRVSER